MFIYLELVCKKYLSVCCCGEKKCRMKKNKEKETHKKNMGSNELKPYRHPLVIMLVME